MWNWFFGPILVTKLDRLGTYAAAMAYCLVLSVVPFLVVTFTLAEQFNLDLKKSYKDLFSEILPAEIDATQVVAAIEKATAVGRSSHGWIATIGFILAVYTSYNLMTQIVRTLLFVFDDPRRPLGWGWSHWLKSFLLLGIWMLLLLVIAVYFVLTPVIRDVLGQLQFPEAIGTTLVAWLQYPVMLVAMFGAFLLTFLLVPSRTPTFLQARDGSLVASFGWVACSVLFSNMVPLLTGGAVYEALGSIVVVLLWAQACAWSVIIGACWMVRFPPRR